MAIRAVVILLILIGYAQCKFIELSCNQIRAFVDGHNWRRLELAKGSVPGQPAASTMNYMVWDDELAAKATKWASRNQFAHNPDRSVGSGRFTTGENLFIYSTTAHDLKLDIDKTLSSWFNEHKQYTYGRLSNSDFNRKDNIQIGHYTQMVWSDSTHVGCGVSQFTRNGWNSYLIVCNYGPTGNFIGRIPYRSGTPSGTLSCATNGCNSPYGDKC
ncbi:venom allergen 5 [Aphomia sociella]